MITNEQIKQAIDDCMNAGHVVSVRDISYALLCIQFEDSLVAYKCLFGNDYDYNKEYHSVYDQTNAMMYLKTYVKITMLKEHKKAKASEDISFEENKAYMLKLKKQTEDAMLAGEIDKKDALKILADISTKLNDKFNVSDTNQEQLIYVTPKFNAICSCGKEIYIPTKEALMEKYNLVEK